MLAYQRGERTLVALNFGTGAATVDRVTGVVRVATLRVTRRRPGRGPLTLAPGEGAVVLLDVLPG